ncbi:hypothetical protein HK096_001040, partial [Nowakowskiella sp. JEL0078]
NINFVSQAERVLWRNHNKSVSKQTNTAYEALYTTHAEISELKLQLSKMQQSFKEKLGQIKMILDKGDDRQVLTISRGSTRWTM